MRRKDKEISDDNIILDILKQSFICRVAFHGDEYPYVVPLNYAYKDDVLYFHCATEGKKLDLIRKNPKVAFEITSHHELKIGNKSCEWTEYYRSIFGQGEIEIVEDFAQKLLGLDALMQHHGKMKNAYDPALIKRVVILKLTIKEMTAKQNGDF